MVSDDMVLIATALLVLAQEIKAKQLTTRQARKACLDITNEALQLDSAILRSGTVA